MIDKSRHGGAVLTDLSKTFDCIDHEFLLAKHNTYTLDSRKYTKGKSKLIL